jgi:hypothetical protein
MRILELHNDEPCIYWSRDRKTWITASDVVWHDQKSDYCIVIPTGFETDLASVPAVFRPICSTYGAYNRASIVHDYLYFCKGKLSHSGPKFSRWQCDKIFFDIMIADGVPAWQALLMYWAVKYNPLNFYPFKKWA